MKLILFWWVFWASPSTQAIENYRTTHFASRSYQINNILDRIAPTFALEKLIGIHFSHQQRPKVGPFFYKLLIEGTNGKVNSCLISYKPKKPRKPLIKLIQCFESLGTT